MKKICSFSLIFIMLVTSFYCVLADDEIQTIAPTFEFADYVSDTYDSLDNGLTLDQAGDALYENNDKISWKVSAAHGGKTPANSRAWISNGNAYVYAGNESAEAMINMDIGNEHFNKITEISFDVINPDSGRKRSVAALLADGNEKAAYAFYIEGDDWWSDDNAYTTRTYTPFVRKYKNYSYYGGEIDNTIEPQTAENIKTKDGAVLTICGPYDPDNGKFGFNYSKAHWDVKFNEKTNIVSWTVTLTPRNDELYAEYTWSDSFKDENLSQMIRNTKYPIAVGSHTNTMAYNNVKIYGELAEKPLISDGFDASCKYNASNQLSFTAGAKNVILQSDTHKWTTSDTIYGAVDTNSKAWINDGKLFLNAGNNSKSAYALMDIGEKSFDKVTKMEFDIINPDSGRQRAYVNLLVDSEQKIGYSFNMESDDWWSDNNAYTTRTYTPYVRKMNNIAYNGGLIATDIIYNGENKLTRNDGNGVLNNVTICGPYDPSNGKFGYNYSHAHWVVTFDKFTDTVSWTVTVYPRNSAYSAYTWTDSFVDKDLSDRIANCKYPFVVGVSTNNMSFDNFKIYGSYETDPLIYDGFDTYFYSQAATFADRLTFEKAYSSGNSPLIARTDKYNWVLSSRIMSDSPSHAYAFFKTNNLAEKGLFINGNNSPYWYDDNSCRLKFADVNMDIGEKRLKNITRISADVYNNSSGSRPYINILVDEYENKFYTFATGMNGNYDKNANAQRYVDAEGVANDDAISAFTPFVAKYSDFEKIDTVIGDSLSIPSAGKKLSGGIISADGAVFNKFYNKVHWDISIDKDKSEVTWTATAYYADGTKNVWKNGFTDPELASMIENARYPVSFGSILNESRFDELKIYGEFEDCLYTVNGDRINVSMKNCGYDEATLVTAFYDSEGKMTDCKKIVKSDSEQAQYDIGTASTIKVFLYEGTDLTANPAKVCTKSDIDYDIPTQRIKVACIGDSLTWGTGATFSYPSELQRFLGYGYDVRNFGKSGSAITDYRPTTNHSYITTDEYTASCEYLPDIVVIMLGINDTYEVYNEEKSQRFYAMYKDLVQSYQNLSSSPEIYCVITPVDSFETDYVGIWQRPAITAICKEQKVNLLDLREIVTDKKLMSDSLHFTNEGYRKIAKNISKAITDKINAIEYFDGKVKINSQLSVLSDVYVAGYNGDKLVGVVPAEGPFTSGKDYIINVPGFVSGGVDNIKLFFWNNGICPCAKDVEITSSYADINDGSVHVNGSISSANTDVVISAFDNEGNLIYIDTVKTDFASRYDKIFICQNADSVYVNGTKTK